MKCKCGYEGLADVGQFDDEREIWKDLKMKVPYSCPNCKSNKDIETIDCLDVIQDIIVNKRMPTHQFSFRILKSGEVMVYTSRPNASGGSCMKKEEVMKLVEKYPNVYFENFGLTNKEVRT